jgi:hypothetical protein
MRLSKQRNSIAVSACFLVDRTILSEKRGRDSEPPLMHCNWNTEHAIEEQSRVKEASVTRKNGLLGLRMCTHNTSDVEASPREVGETASPTIPLASGAFQGGQGAW